MSILNEQQPQQVPPAERIANQMVNQARMAFQQLVSVYNEGSRSFWSNPRATPQEISSALGNRAAEVFDLHGKIGALLAQVKPEAIQPGQSVVGQFTVNADGTVTVPEAPAQQG
jgi:hypothetical protein